MGPKGKQGRQLPITEGQFYAAQSGMPPGILACARKIVDVNKDALSSGTWPEIDSSWNDHRSATEHCRTD
jgi:hypothetical protein